MDITNFFGILLAGVLANNCLVANCTGIDITTNGTRSMKNASIYSLIIFGVMLMSSITIYICKNIMVYYGLASVVFLVAMVIVAIYVQIAEFIAKKVCPVFVKQMNYFIPILAGTMMFFMLGLTATAMSFGKMILYVLFNSLGIWIVLLLIAGIKKNFTHDNLQDKYKGLVMSLVIVFILAIIWTAF